MNLNKFSLSDERKTQLKNGAVFAGKAALVGLEAWAEAQHEHEFDFEHATEGDIAEFDGDTVIVEKECEGHNCEVIDWREFHVTRFDGLEWATEVEA